MSAHLVLFPLVVVFVWSLDVAEELARDKVLDPAPIGVEDGLDGLSGSLGERDGHGWGRGRVKVGRRGEAWRLDWETGNGCWRWWSSFVMSCCSCGHVRRVPMVLPREERCVS